MGGKSYINILHSLDKEMVNKLVRMVETFNGQLTRKFAEDNKGDSQDETYPVDLAYCYFRIACYLQGWPCSKKEQQHVSVVDEALHCYYLF